MTRVDEIYGEIVEVEEALDDASPTDALALRKERRELLNAIADEIEDGVSSDEDLCTILLYAVTALQERGRREEVIHALLSTIDALAETDIHRVPIGELRARQTEEALVTGNAPPPSALH